LGGIILEIMVMLSYALNTHPLIVFATRIMEAIAYACVIFVAIAKMEDIVAGQKKTNDGEQVGKSLSIGKLGHVFGPLAGSIIAASFGLTAPFFGSVILLIILGGWYFFEKHNVHPKPPFEKLTYNPVPAIRAYLKNPPLKGLSIVEGAHQFSMPVLFVFIPLFLTRDLGFSLAQVGMVIFIRELPMLFQFWGGKLSDTWGSQKTILLGSTLSGVSLLALSQIRTFDWILVSSLLFGIGTSLLGISGLSLLSGIAQKEKKEGTYLGSQVSVIKIGAFTAFLIGGVIVQITSIPTLFLFTGVIILLGVIVGESLLGFKSFPLPDPKRLISGIFHHR
jgi:MFS family permease